MSASNLSVVAAAVVSTVENIYACSGFRLSISVLRRLGSEAFLKRVEL